MKILHFVMQISITTVIFIVHKKFDQHHFFTYRKIYSDKYEWGIEERNEGDDGNTGNQGGNVGN